MATVTRENIGVLNDKITVTVGKEDYLSAFEKTLKTYSKTANIPGFRKGMVPTGIIKKMHGQAVFVDEVFRAVSGEMSKYLDEQKLDIFGQPLPLPENDVNALDVNNPKEYTFNFEVGLKPEFTLPELSKETLPVYKVQASDEMVEKQVERIRKGYGKKKDPEGGDGEENIELAEINEDLFKAAYPGKEIKTEEEFRSEIRRDIEGYWETQSKNHFSHEIYHLLLDKTEIGFPDSFLKRFLETGGEKQKTAEEVEQEYPGFLKNLKWSLITDKIAEEQKLTATEDEIKDLAKKQLLGYLGMQSLDNEDGWMDDYVNRMMQDKKFVDDTYNRLMTDKIFDWAAAQVQKEDKPVSEEQFGEELKKHQHHHH